MMLILINLKKKLKNKIYLNSNGVGEDYVMIVQKFGAKLLSLKLKHKMFFLYFLLMKLNLNLYLEIH